MTSKNQTKTFSDISKDIQKKYNDRYDAISLKGLSSEMQRLRDMQDEVKASMQPVPTEEVTEQFFNGGLFDKITIGADSGNSSMMIPQFNLPNRKPDFGINANINPFGTDPTTMNDRTYGVPATQATTESSTTYGRDPLMYASALGPVAALLMNKKTDPIDRSQPGRFVSTGAAGVGTSAPRQTEFKEVSMSPIERALSERARGFSGANAQVSGGNAGQFLANELANQVNTLAAQSQASLGQQQMNTQIAGMNAGEQARIDAIKQQDIQRKLQAESTNAQLALRYDEIDAMNEGAFRTNQSNAVQSIFQNLGNIGRENTQGNIILKALGYDEMGNYGGQGKNSFAFLDQIIGNFLKKK